MEDGLNLYVYVRNNPVTYLDPDGREAELPFYLNENEYGGKPVLTFGLHDLPIVNKKKYLVKNRLKLKILKRNILKLGVAKIDYIEILDINKLIKPFKKKRKYKIFIAYYLGSTRLIDNIKIN